MIKFIQFSLLVTIFNLFIFISETSYAAEPLFSSYPESNLYKTNIIASEDTAVLANYLPNETGDKRFVMQSFIGDAEHYAYSIDNVSTLAVFQNYKSAMKDLGFNILFECPNKACGKINGEQKKFAGRASFFDLSNNYKKSKYLLAEKKGNSSIVASLYVAQYYKNVKIQLTIINVKPIKLGLIQADIAAYRKQPSNEKKKAAREDVKNGKDHPLIQRYPSSHIINYKQVDYDEISLAIEVPQKSKDNFKRLDVVGDITQITYGINNVSTLKIFRNYIAGLTKAGFEPVYSCEKKSCSDIRSIKKDLAKMVGDYDVSNYVNKVRYQLMKSQQNDQTTYVAIYVGSYSDKAMISLAIVRTEPLQKGLVEANSDKILNQIKQKGKASVYGILFDYDKADIKPESQAALKIIMDVLNKDKTLNIYVVGHTDDSGKPEYNLALSERRAASVTKALINDYGIDASRLKSHGAGPYSPVATNHNDLGRQLNRRVELVEKLSE